MKINDLFMQKFNEIQSRLPLKMNPPAEGKTFSQVLAKESAQPEATTPKVPVVSNKAPTNQFKSPIKIATAVDKEGNDKTAELLRAKSNLSTSKSEMPADQSALMTRINDAILNAAVLYDVDPNLIRSIIKQESGFVPTSISRSGAQGLMQLMPGTADSLGVVDPFNIEENIDGGTKYFRDQLRTFNGDIKLALAAYNAGPGNVKKHNGIPPFNETQNYVKKVTDYYNMYKNQ
jgi:soluble lytic murein transglycosylase-like protein